jgi:hypothetical protein
MYDVRRIDSFELRQSLSSGNVSTMFHALQERQFEQIAFLEICKNLDPTLHPFPGMLSCLGLLPIAYSSLASLVLAFLLAILAILLALVYFLF